MPEPTENGDDLLPVPSSPHATRKIQSRALWTLLLVLGLQNMAVRLMNLPLNRVIELRYCQLYYQEHDPSVIDPSGNIPEQLCKLDRIQQRLAWLQGAIETFHVICGLY
jgi:hypothetical protein